MPRHPPVALKTLDHSHCQCPPGPASPNGTDRKTSFSRSARWSAVKRPITMAGNERSRPTHCESSARTNLLFTMSCRTGGRPYRPQTFFQRMTHSNTKPSAGGAGRDRTDDPLLAKQVLSQLSYGPSCADASEKMPPRSFRNATPQWLATRSPHRCGWWAWIDSNYRPHPYQGCALTT